MVSNIPKPAIPAGDIHAVLRGEKQAPADSTCADYSRAESFGEPILFEKAQTPEIEAEVLPGWLGEYVSALSKFTQTPPAMAAMLSLAVIAACVQKRYEISPQGFTYREPLSLWVAVAMPPASRKTAVLAAITAPLSDWERRRAIELKPKIEEVEIHRDYVTRCIESLLRDSAKKKGGQPIDGVKAEVQELRADLPSPIHLPRTFLSDCTPEGLRNELVEQQGRMAVISDEGGIFDIMGGIYSDSGTANNDIFLKGHAGGPLRVKRSGQVVDIANIAISFGLAIQPEVLSDLSHGSKRSFRGKGLLARFFFVVPQSNIGTRDVTRCEPISEHLQSDYRRRIQQLLNVEPRIDELGEEQPKVLILSSEALVEYHRFSQEIENAQGEGRKYERIQDFTGKLAGQALRIAGLMHLVEYFADGTCVVSRETFLRAVKLSRKLLEHAIVAFDSMGGDPVVNDAKFALNWAMSHHEVDTVSGARFIRQNELHKSGRFKNSKLERVLKALEVLLERHIVSPRRFLEPASGKGRPASIFYLNPVIFQNTPPVDRRDRRDRSKTDDNRSVPFVHSVQGGDA